MIQIIKGERGEQQIEALRTQLVDLANATAVQNYTRTALVQKKALLALADVGGEHIERCCLQDCCVSAFASCSKLLLLPQSFLCLHSPTTCQQKGNTRTCPVYWDVPRWCVVCWCMPVKEKGLEHSLFLAAASPPNPKTFGIRRKKKLLGNITIVADGFTAPITAGNFVDLSIRNFYTGLPVKIARKKVGSGGAFEVATLPILGNFQEGFYDPLTAKLRRIPLEIIRLERGSVPKLSYAEDDASSPGARWDFSDTPSSVSDENGKSLLSFEIPGLVALNHPASTLGGGSAAFFGLRSDSLPEEKRKLLNGEYACFGFIVEGYDLFLKLEAGDVIDSTYVDELGQLNLVKLRESSFSEVVQGSDQSHGESSNKETETAATALK